MGKKETDASTALLFLLLSTVGLLEDTSKEISCKREEEYNVQNLASNLKEASMVILWYSPGVGKEQFTAVSKRAKEMWHSLLLGQKEKQRKNFLLPANKGSSDI